MPTELVKKAPSDGMCGMTDEEKLGFTYSELEKVATGKTDGMTAERVAYISSRLKGYSWKRKLLNLPCYIPENKKPEDF